MKRLIAWLKRIWTEPEPEYWQALDRMDDEKYIVDLWMPEQATEDSEGSGKAL